jgi:nitronate monooxygenase
MATTREDKILRTRLCDMLGIKYPIIQAGMGTVSGPALAAAVSNAGGLGVLAAIDLTADELQQWIKKTKTLTDKPFAVDTVFIKSLPQKRSIDEVRAQLPADSLEFAERMRVDIGLPKVHGRVDTATCSRQVIEDQFEVCVAEDVPVLVSALGNPDWLLPQARAHKMTVLGLVGNVKEARQVTQTGVDIIIAQGYEAGGHTGRIGSLALIPQVVDAVYPTPVVAAGGIADGRGLVASLALGAIGVWCGTAFAASHEACVDHIEAGIYTQWEIDLRKQKILQATEDDPRITKVVTGKTLRNLGNEFVKAWEGKGGPILKEWPFQNTLVADLQEGIRRKRMAEYFPWAPAGQGVGLIKELKSAQQIVDDMVNEAVEILGNKLRREVDIGLGEQRESS